MLVTVGADGSASVVMTFCLREMYPSLSANDCLITDIGLHVHAHDVDCEAAALRNFLVHSVTDAIGRLELIAEVLRLEMIP